MDTSHTVGSLWTRDRAVAEAATLTHNMHTRETSVPSTIAFLCLALHLQWLTRCSVRTFNYSYAAGVGTPYAVDALMGGIKKPLRLLRYLELEPWGHWRVNCVFDLEGNRDTKHSKLQFSLVSSPVLCCTEHPNIWLRTLWHADCGRVNHKTLHLNFCVYFNFENSSIGLCRGVKIFLLSVACF
jgi:hypothetical protein